MAAGRRVNEVINPDAGHNGSPVREIRGRFHDVGRAAGAINARAKLSLPQPHGGLCARIPVSRFNQRQLTEHCNFLPDFVFTG